MIQVVNNFGEHSRELTNRVRVCLCEVGMGAGEALVEKCLVSAFNGRTAGEIPAAKRQKRLGKRRIKNDIEIHTHLSEFIKLIDF